MFACCVEICTKIEVQTTGFLLGMAEHFTQRQSVNDHSSSSAVDTKPDAEGPHFDPMRRKLQINVGR